MSLVKVTDNGGATMDMVDVGGFIHPYFFRPPEETKSIFEAVRNFLFRNDDLLLCSFPKTGSNWMFEILMMIQTRSSQTVQTNKAATMLELCTTEEVNQVKSPRVLNSHYPLRYLPLTDMRNKQIKTVVCLRNPKDTAVSYYNHMVGIKTYSYAGNWKDWLPAFLEGKLEYGKYFDYILDWERLQGQGPGFPLHVVYFEDLKQNGIDEMERLLSFLNVDLETELKEDILDKCRFDHMSREKNISPEGQNEVFFKKEFKFFRKGEVGDWKNWFTVAQNELFDELWNEETRQSKLCRFKYGNKKDS